MTNIRHKQHGGRAARKLPASRRLRRRGFTLIELLVTLAVAAILLAVAVPSFRTFIQNAKLNNAADGFLAAIQQARSEAITRGNLVVLCRTDDPSSDSCGGSGSNNWSEGWLMYATPGASSESSYSPSDHVLIRRGSPTPDGVDLTSDADGNSWLAFGGDGALAEPLNNGDSLVAYAVCDERGEKDGRLIVIPEIGRPYMTNSETNSPRDELSSGPGAPNCAPND